MPDKCFDLVTSLSIWVSINILYSLDLYYLLLCCLYGEVVIIADPITVVSLSFIFVEG